MTDSTPATAAGDPPTDFVLEADGTLRPSTSPTRLALPRTRWRQFWRFVAAALSGPSGGGPQ